MAGLKDATELSVERYQQLMEELARRKVEALVTSFDGPPDPAVVRLWKPGSRQWVPVPVLSLNLAPRIFPQIAPTRHKALLHLVSDLVSEGSV